MVLSSVTLAPNLLAVVDETGGLSGDGLPGDWAAAGMTTARATRTKAAWTFPRRSNAGCRCRQGFGMANSRVVGIEFAMRAGVPPVSRIVAEARQDFWLSAELNPMCISTEV